MSAVVDAEHARLLAERCAEELHDRVDALESVAAAPVVDGRVGGEAARKLVPPLLIQAAPVAVLQALDRLEILERLDACCKSFDVRHAPLRMRRAGDAEAAGEMDDPVARRRSWCKRPCGNTARQGNCTWSSSAEADLGDEHLARRAWRDPAAGQAVW